MSLLQEMKQDEHIAPIEYRKLYKQIKKKKDRSKIKRIIRDEKKHLKLLNSIKQ